MKYTKNKESNRKKNNEKRKTKIDMPVSNKLFRFSTPGYIQMPTDSTNNVYIYIL